MVHGLRISVREDVLRDMPCAARVCLHGTAVDRRQMPRDLSLVDCQKDCDSFSAGVGLDAVYSMFTRLRTSVLDSRRRRSSAVRVES